MKKLAVLCVAALGAALLVWGPAPVASAYPEVTCNVTVDRQTVSPGDTFTATGESATSARWTFRWNGVTKVRTGSTVHASFTAPEVTRSRKITLTARAEGATGSTCVHHITVTVAAAVVSAPGGGGSGGLPSTGGPTFWLLVAGLLLLLGGGTAAVAGRKRH
jgi:LPXTG-motif cell wall-anchored protein